MDKIVLEININDLRKYELKKILINKYCDLLMELNEVNKELYNMTELYEEQYMLDYNHDLFNIFKNKLGYYTKLYKKIKEAYNEP